MNSNSSNTKLDDCLSQFQDAWLANDAWFDQAYSDCGDEVLISYLCKSEVWIVNQQNQNAIMQAYDDCED